MILKRALILLTLVAVVADSMLLPFYPKFFAQEFGNTNPEHVGWYIAACCFTVMVTLPLWAKLAHRVDEFHLWVITQIAAGTLALCCYRTQSLAGFWLFSQTMLVFKSSYLLIYPLVMRLEEKDKHLGVAGLFSVLIHFGAIAGALIGGALVEFAEPRKVYLIMAATDGLQVIVCALVIRLRRLPLWQPPQVIAQEQQTEAQAAGLGNPLIMQLGVVSLLFYFSAFMMRPFFARYWEVTAAISNDLFAGFVYSIPAWVALAGLWLNHRWPTTTSSYTAVFRSLIFALAGALLQGVAHPLAIIAGRILYGWALFQGTVRLEVLVFELSERQHYAMDFSKIHIFQNVGVLLSSFLVGSVVAGYGLQMPFAVAAGGFVITGVAFVMLFRSRLWPSLARMPSV